MSNDDVVIAMGVTKHYASGVVAVSDLDLRVRRGEVFGFLGPNGAGKTTTMRMLVGLIRPTSGTITVAGAAAGSRCGLSRVGALIESPAFYPHLSGRDNLRVLARYCGVPDARVDEVLTQVEMADRAGRDFRTFSLGMKQRLGVAAALLKEPDLLILDEPTNGLDPAGMADMRALVRSLRHERHAVLLSSHLLSEVEQLCDRVAVIRNGRLVAQGTVPELRAASGAAGTITVRATPAARAEELLRAHPAVRSVERTDDLLRLTTDPAEAARINRDLVSVGVDVSELRPAQRSLEDIFFQLTEDQPAAGMDEIEVATA